ncbi:MAG: DUF1761 family protein [Flavobacteriales bacterium]|nr:DUF1761 family protein [Flavobacteriales bacterium]
MDLNYFAFFLIAFIPVITSFFWYHPKSPIVKWAGTDGLTFGELNFAKLALMFVLSFTVVYGYINLVIHQMGFYELFFTDIMKGNEEAKVIVSEFLSKYGRKHRHFGHGVFHGIINAFVFCVPFFGLQAILQKISFRKFTLDFSYWLFTSASIGGLIAEFV